MKNLLLTVMLLPASVAANAFVAEGDSVSTLNDQQIEEVVVQGVRVQKNAPFAVANIKKSELREFAQSGQELPFLLSKTPGVMAWGDNGVGTGTSFLRIRGAGDSRINVTIDGVPLNSPEDQQVFWANMNGYAHMLGSLQVQRGVGTSTNGDGAFGGTLSLGMKAPSEKATAELTGSIGSYNTYHYGASFSTGLLWGRLIFDGMYHETITDGFIHGTDGRSGSYLGRLTYKANRFVLSYKNFGNFEKTGQAWNGVTAGNDDKSIMDGTYGKHTGIHTYKDLYDAGLGQYNSLVDRLVFNPDGTFHTEPYTMSDGSIWRKTTDNFWQNHNILSLVWDMGEHWKTTASLHYTHGYGYYRELKPDTKPKKFGLSNVDLDGNEGTAVQESTLRIRHLHRPSGAEQGGAGWRRLSVLRLRCTQERCQRVREGFVQHHARAAGVCRRAVSPRRLQDNGHQRQVLRRRRTMGKPAAERRRALQLPEPEGRTELRSGPTQGLRVGGREP